MARFQGVLRSERGGKVTRLGHSSMFVESNAWTFGVTLHSFVTEGKEVIRIIKNGGSAGKGENKVIGYLVDGEFHLSLDRN